MRRISAFALALGAAGAAALVGCATPAAEAPLTGAWGGEHVGLLLEPSGGRLEYDCAAGTIAGPLVPAPDGSFAASGTHTPGLGGPERIGHVPPAYPARYRGTIARETMTLHVAVPSRDLALGPFRLRRNAPPRLLRCL